MATDGAISKTAASSMSLSDKEMKEVMGGWYEDYKLGNFNTKTTGMIQVVGKLAYEFSNSKQLYMVSEMYGPTLSSGYRVYVTTDLPDNAKLVYTARGQVRQFTEDNSVVARASLSDNLIDGKNALLSAWNKGSSSTSYSSPSSGMSTVTATNGTVAKFTPITTTKPNLIVRSKYAYRYGY